MRPLVIFLSAAMFLGSTAALADTLHVPGDYPTIQAAIDAASDGDEIIVAPGTYHEAINFLGKAIHLHSSDGPDSTKIDAEGLDASVVTCISGEGPATILEGFTIAGGVGTGEREYNRVGGGMFVDGSSPSVIGCTFRDNRARDGGGIFARSSDLVVSACVFSGNHVADTGGGITTFGSAPRMEDCLFRGNVADGGGGGIYNTSDATVIRCIFVENRSGFDGGGAFNARSVTLYEDCTFRENHARRGGGMSNQSGTTDVVGCTFVANSGVFDGGGMQATGTTRISRCTFEGNKARSAGAVFIQRGETSILDSRFERNRAQTGGALNNDWESILRATRCVFLDNESTSGVGGAIRAQEDTFLTRCLLEGNISAEEGGAVWGADITLQLRQCTFRSNTSAERGGAVFIRGTALATECELIDNSATLGGGLFCSDSSHLELRDLRFEGNRAVGTGGRGGGVLLAKCTGFIDRAVFVRNRANRGGGVYNLEGEVSLLACRFEGNVAVIRGGGIFNEREGLLVADTSFSGNVAHFGGGIQNWYGSSVLVNCTFSANQGRSDGGGVLSTNDSFPTLYNCVLWGNEPDQVSDDRGAESLVEYSDIQGGRSGEGNIDADPLFVRDPDAGADGEWGTSDDDYGDLRLRVSSPCIDAADNTAVPEGVILDLDGLPRFVDDPDTDDTGRCDDPCDRPIVDMGAYEFQALAGGCVRDPEWVCDGDVDGDGQVNPVDAGLVQAAFGSGDEQDLCNYDVDCDGQINPVDSGIVQSLFGTCEAPREVCP